MEWCRRARRRPPCRRRTGCDRPGAVAEGSSALVAQRDHHAPWRWAVAGWRRPLEPEISAGSLAEKGPKACGFLSNSASLSGSRRSAEHTASWVADRRRPRACYAISSRSYRPHMTNLAPRQFRISLFGNGQEEDTGDARPVRKQEAVRASIAYMLSC